jgi:UDP-N-acetylmuramoyl-tripeptide--D-alanyl-D-alanine ligase
MTTTIVGMARKPVGTFVRAVRRRMRRLHRKATARVVFGLARLNRRLHRRVTVIGVTGSAGKTTTKDLCAAMLSEFGGCRSTDRSSNEHLPVARVIKGLRRSHRYCVVELSESQPGYMDLSLELTLPNMAVLTVIGRDHYSQFRSLERIAAETAKVVDALAPDEIAVLNMDDPLIRRIGEARDRSVIWIGESADATVRLLEAKSVWPEPLTLTVAHNGSTYEIQTRLHGTHLALNVLAALGVAVGLKLPLDRVIAALGKVEPPEARMQIVECDDGVTFLRDDFKAPHWSFQAPLDFLAAARAARKIAVVGSVSDSAQSPSRRYKGIAADVRKVAELAVFVGADAHHALKARSSPDDQSIQAFADLRDARDFLNSVLAPGDFVLLKGSSAGDHLVRLVIDRSKPVLCWKRDCRLKTLCTLCPRVHQPGESNADTAAAVAGPKLHALATSDAPFGNGPMVVVGLGNPGQQHRDTAHNVGAHVVERLAASANGEWQEQAEGLVSFVSLAGTDVVLLKPGVAMNSSGDRIRALLQRLGGSAATLIVVHDDMDLALGDVRRKRNGGAGGHRGVASVIAALDTFEFRRVRVGVRQVGEQREARHLVLKDVPSADAQTLDAAYARAIAMIREDVGGIPGAREAGQLTTSVPRGA